MLEWMVGCKCLVLCYSIWDLYVVCDCVMFLQRLCGTYWCTTAHCIESGLSPALGSSYEAAAWKKGCHRVDHALGREERPVL